MKKPEIGTRVLAWVDGDWEILLYYGPERRGYAWDAGEWGCEDDMVEFWENLPPDPAIEEIRRRRLVLFCFDDPNGRDLCMFQLIHLDSGKPVISSRTLFSWYSLLSHPPDGIKDLLGSNFSRLFHEESIERRNRR